MLIEGRLGRLVDEVAEVFRVAEDDRLLRELVTEGLEDAARELMLVAGRDGDEPVTGVGAGCLAVGFKED